MTETIINQNNSLVTITRGWLEHNNAQSIFEKLEKETLWSQEILKFYGKEVQQPRKTYACGQKGLVHKYSGLSLPLHPWIPEVELIKNLIESVTHLHFNGCLLNYYADGRNFIGYHHDSEVMNQANLDNQRAVATVSLGATRRFYFKTRTRPFETIKTELYNGDFLLMTGETQDHYNHSIVKQSNVGPRISLTYRLLE